MMNFLKFQKNNPQKYSSEMSEFPREMLTFQQCVFRILRILKFHKKIIQKRHSEKVVYKPVEFHPFWGPKRPKRKRSLRNLPFDPKWHMAPNAYACKHIYVPFLLIIQLIDNFN